MPLKLKPISFPNDRASIASIITLANFTDPYGQIVWPDSAIPWRIAGSYARLPGTVLSPGAMFMKVVEANGEKEDEEEEIVAYAQWTFPASLWAKMGGRERFSEINEETREQFRREKADSCGADGNPLGMRVEVVEACSPAMEVAGRECFPQEEEFIVLDQVKTLPNHQRKGAGSLLLEWGTEIADREGLKICLEATPFGLGLYEKFGFRRLKEVRHDIERFGGPREGYTHTLMMREPKSGS